MRPSKIQDGALLRRMKKFRNLLEAITTPDKSLTKSQLVAELTNIGASEQDSKNVFGLIETRGFVSIRELLVWLRRGEQNKKNNAQIAKGIHTTGSSKRQSVQGKELKSAIKNVNMAGAFGDGAADADKDKKATKVDDGKQEVTSWRRFRYEDSYLDIWTKDSSLQEGLRLLRKYRMQLLVRSTSFRPLFDKLVAFDGAAPEAVNVLSSFNYVSKHTTNLVQISDFKHF